MDRQNIQHWQKTEEGQAMIQNNAQVFALDNQLWQGFGMSPIPVNENSLTAEEMEAVVDVDGSLGAICTTRRQRLEGRNERKIREYEKRRAELRVERSAIRASMKEDMEMGLPQNPADIQQIKEIDKRMQRLSDLSAFNDLEAARRNDPTMLAELHRDQARESEARITEAVEKGRPLTDCPHCLKPAPDDHHNPGGWLRGHLIHCKAAKAERAERAEKKAATG